MKIYFYLALIQITVLIYPQQERTESWGPNFNAFRSKDPVVLDTYLNRNNLVDSIWYSIGPGANDILAMTFGENNADVIYAASRDSGVIKTINGGLDWNQVNNGITENFIRSIDSHPQNSNIILAGTYYGGLFRSDDGGNSWKTINSVEDSTILCVAFDQLHGDTVYVGTFTQGVYRSLDAGITWQRVSQDSMMALQVIIDPVDQNILYYVSPSDYSVFRSSDFGNSWNLLYTGYPYIISLAINPLNNKTIFMGTNPLDGIYKSIDGGITWEIHLINGEGYIVTDIVIDQNDTNNVYISTAGWGVFRSTNSGETWSSMSEGLTALQVIQLKLDPLNTSTMYATTNGAAIFKIEGLVSGLIETKHFNPNEYQLFQNYPNPFNPSTTIRYEIPEQSLVTMKVYDVLGNEIAILVNEEKTAGTYKVELDASSLTSGIYFYQLQASSYVETKKMIFLK